MIKVITVKIDVELLERLDEFAMTNRLTRSEVVREAIVFFLDEKAKAPPAKMGKLPALR